MKNKEIVIYMLLFLVICVSGYLIYTQGNSLSERTDSVSDKKEIQTTGADLNKSNIPSDEKKDDVSKVEAIPGWKTYENQKLGYNLQYPSDWTASDEGKMDPAYPYDTEIYKEYADAEKGFEYNIGITSNLYGANPDGSVSDKASSLKNVIADSNYKKIITINGEGYYMVDETLGGPSWTVQVFGDKGVVTMTFSVGDQSKESLYKQIIGTFRFN